MSLYMLNFNCHSICSKVPQIFDYIIEKNIDIALVQETWLKKVDTAIVAQIKEYNFKIEQVCKPRILDIGGVAMLFKNKLILKKVKIETFASFEHITCSAKMKTNNIIYFLTVYYPGYSLKHRYTAMQFLSDFNDFLTTCSEDIPLITVDFDIHYEDTKRLETEELIKILSQHDFTQ